MPRPERPGPTATGPEPGEKDRRVRADDDIIDPHTGQERPGVETPVAQPVDGTYGGLAAPGHTNMEERTSQRVERALGEKNVEAPSATEATTDSADRTVPERDGPRAYTREAQRSDDPGAPPTGSTVQSGSGRPDRF